MMKLIDYECKGHRDLHITGKSYHNHIFKNNDMKLKIISIFTLFLKIIGFILAADQIQCPD